jgi:hypothetical protein
MPSRVGEVASGNGSRAGLDRDRLRGLLEQSLAGKLPSLTPAELRSLQACALRSVARLFTNQFHDDGPLLGAVGDKLAHYGDVARSVAFDQALFGRGDVRQQQREALDFMLLSFRGADEADAVLRMQVLQKLARIGENYDLRFILPHARKGTPGDIYFGLQAVREITTRCGPPQRRARLAHDPAIGPLLAKDGLCEAERQQVLEAVLSRGEIDLAQTRPHRGHNRNPVLFLTFFDTLPGKHGQRQPIRAVWKPERTYYGKDEAFFSREVAAYEFDKHFAKTGLVPPTVEAILSVNGEPGCEVGSLQWMVPNSQPLGNTDAPYPRNVHEFHPRFGAFRKTERYQEQERRIRTLVYILGDPDKFGNNVIPTSNLLNLLVDADERIWMIDNAFSFGAPNAYLSSRILPPKPDAYLAEKLRQVRSKDVAATLDRFVEDWYAKDAVRRFKKVRDGR